MNYWPKFVSIVELDPIIGTHKKLLLYSLWCQVSV